ncbi:MAG TPA: UDP-N-acetylglucosamine 1-carboxyvinyltransferase [Candidatus Kapabacteria bacterium]|nr:UDP-N-acetylglucosamine 1-carboxyvinyltransferase [Candidatus Kapabacteria bacterium]
MARFVITGGKALHGTVQPIGNKNAVVKMIPATLLTTEPVTLTHVPDIRDVDTMLSIMKTLGTDITYDKTKGVLTLQTKTIMKTIVDPDLAKKLRASNMFLGPLLARKGMVTGIMPGGDKIGPREMNAHFDGLRQLGARYKKNADDSFTLKGKVVGADVFLYEPSVTATENVILAAVLASGETTITNAASEPHVQELCRMLNGMGATIDGIGTNRLHIVGVDRLHGTTHQVPVDYIYVGTMVVLAAITGGELTIQNVVHDDLKTIVYFFEKLGVRTVMKGNDLVVPGKQRLVIRDHEWARIKGVYSQPWPCFPSDMMSLMIVLATQVKGSTLFFEKMYSGRMFFADYLNGLGANIIIADPYRVVVNGKSKLRGGTLYATDIRAGMAYVAAGLCAEGKTVVEHVDHIDRGYPHIEKVLQALGARIERVES